MPRERVEAKPSTSTECVRRRSVSPSRGFSRAIRQQILVEPTSSTLTMVERREPSGLIARHAGRTVLAAALTCAPWPLRVGAAVRGHVFERAALRQPHGDAVGQAQIDDDDVAREELLLGVRA